MNLKRVLKYLVFIYILFITALVSSWAVWHIYEGGKRFNEKTKKNILRFASFISLINKNSLLETATLSNPYAFNSTSINGFDFKTHNNQIKGYLLISTINEKTKLPFVKLIEIKTGVILKEWCLKKSDLKQICSTENQPIYDLRIVHPLLLKDKSIVFNTGFALLKIDSSSNIAWQTNIPFHHSLELENDSILWAPSRIINSKLFQFNLIDTLVDDAICSINVKNNKVLIKKSVAQLLIDNGYSNLLFTGPWENDLIHLNDIQPALTTTKFWNKGDLLISLNHRSSVLLYRPATNKIIWLKTGPWISQHDCDFIDSSRIMIFGNDYIRTKSGTLLHNHNTAYIYDFNTNKTSTPFEKLFYSEKIKTLSEGRCDLLSNGDLFVDESNNGRLIIGDSTKAKLIYTERINKSKIKLFNWVRYLPTLPF